MLILTGHRGKMDLKIGEDVINISSHFDFDYNSIKFTLLINSNGSVSKKYVNGYHEWYQLNNGMKLKFKPVDGKSKMQFRAVIDGPRHIRINRIGEKYV